MEVLKATQAREIDKASITEAETLVVNGEMAKATAASVMQAGDFYFRTGVRTYEVPASWFRRIFLRKASKTIAEIKTGIVISCPFCGLPIMTGDAHTVLSKRPLTIERPIACPLRAGGTWRDPRFHHQGRNHHRRELMAKRDHSIPRTLTAKGPSWPIRAFRKFAARIDPEIYEQDQQITFDRFGIRKAVGGKFGEFADNTNPMAIYRPSGGHHIDPEKAMANNRGFVYAATNAIAREIMNIDWRLFAVNGKDHVERTDHDLLDLLDSVNPDMTGQELKYMLSTHLDLTGNAYWYLDGVNEELGKPTAIYPLDPSKVRVVLDTSTFPCQIEGYSLKVEDKTIRFKPYQILHFRPSRPLERL